MRVTHQAILIHRFLQKCPELFNAERFIKVHIRLTQYYDHLRLK